MITGVLHKIRDELQCNADPETVKITQRFFKEPIRAYGIKTPTVKWVAKKYSKEMKEWNRREVLDLCTELWKDGYLEESIIACELSLFLEKSFELADFQIFEFWLTNFVDNWAACDGLCNHTVGAFVSRYPHFLNHLKRWTLSENRWLRRAAAVSLIIPARKGRFLDDIFQIADSLLEDKDDLVQKGYGWMLKAASEAHERQVFEYVIGRKDRMPRTALRYAIEKMAPDLRKKAMER